ncbi:MAG: chemotaxis protein CheW, partial [Acidobacteriota bacterium]
MSDFTHSPASEEALEGAAMLRELVARIDAGLDLESEVPSPSPGRGAGSPQSPAEPETPAPRASAAKVASQDGEGVLHVLFELGGSIFSFPAAACAEVRPYEAPMPIPSVPPWILGIESFRGEVLSVSDLSAFLGFSKLTPTDHSRAVVVFDPRTTKRALTVLAVDAVLTHQWLPEKTGGEKAAAALGGRLGRFAERIVELDGEHGQGSLGGAGIEDDDR